MFLCSDGTHLLVLDSPKKNLMSDKVHICLDCLHTVYGSKFWKEVVLMRDCLFVHLEARPIMRKALTCTVWLVIFCTLLEYCTLQESICNLISYRRIIVWIYHGKSDRIVLIREAQWRPSWMYWHSVNGQCKTKIPKERFTSAQDSDLPSNLVAELFYRVNLVLYLLLAALITMHHMLGSITKEMRLDDNCVRMDVTLRSWDK